MVVIVRVIISTDKDPSLRIESFAVIDLRGVSTKLYFNSVSLFMICLPHIVTHVFFSVGAVDAKESASVSHLHIKYF